MEECGVGLTQSIASLLSSNISDQVCEQVETHTQLKFYCILDYMYMLVCEM